MKKPIFVFVLSAFGLLLIAGCSNDGSDSTNGVSNTVASSLAVNSTAYQANGILAVMGEDDGHPWGDHAAPWNFLWNNGLDMNHELKI